MRISWGKRRWSSAGTVLQVTTVCLALAMCIGCLHWGPDPGEYAIDCDSAACGSQDCEAYLCLPKHRYSRRFDEDLASHEAAIRADQSMRESYPERPNFDFRYGYGQAFVDVALGGDGTVPPVPPECYWSTCYRTAGGHQSAQDWFDGYAAGACKALDHCRYQFNRVASPGVTAFAVDDPSQSGIIPAGGDPYSTWESEGEAGW